MNEITFPVFIRANDCRMPVTYGNPGEKELKENHRFFVNITPESGHILFSTDNLATAEIVKRIWDVDTPTSCHSTPDIIVQRSPSKLGRFIDKDAGQQWIFADYVPFTIIKQALRWQVALECANTNWLPLHGVILLYQGKCVCFVGSGGAGKSFLADSIIHQYPGGTVLVDDWCLVDSDTTQVNRIGDAHLHVRGAAVQRESPQLEGGRPELIELCDNDPGSSETRYLIRRDSLLAFNCEPRIHFVNAIVILSDPFADRFVITGEREKIMAITRAEHPIFWDNSNIGLPQEVTNVMSQKWDNILSKTVSISLKGYRSAGIESATLVESITQAIVGG